MGLGREAEYWRCLVTQSGASSLARLPVGNNRRDSLNAVLILDPSNRIQENVISNPLSVVLIGLHRTRMGIVHRYENNEELSLTDSHE